jgi:serine/threonine-protein phosphatase 2A activator
MQCITNEAALNIFKNSTCYAKIIDFVIRVANQAKLLGLNLPKNDDSVVFSNFFDDLTLGLSQFPPENQLNSRFGNVQFRKWHDWAETVINAHPFFDEESKMYLISSFGDRTRLDYGTGHELNFLVFLMGNFESQKITELSLFPVFVKYFQISRKIIDYYNLEPAGSHGVWGLDDYSHLNFLFGAAQLSDLKYVLIVQVFDRSSDFKRKGSLFADALNLVIESKKVPLKFCAPVLHGLKNEENFGRVTVGLLQMYKREVLEKRVVVQHLRFGSKILVWPSSNLS